MRQKGNSLLLNKNSFSSIGKIFLRRIPYPYQAMLAICSDLDETPDKEVYFEIMRYLNTTEETKIGPGVGLEVGNTIYFDMPPDQFSYWNTDDHGRGMVRELIKSGHIDCLHSFGDLATTRTHAGRALEELDRYGCRLKVWIDHGTAPSNFGPDIMRGRGDIVGSDVYHADLTFGYGIQYIWVGRVTSVIGQDVERKLGGIWNSEHPLASARTIAKETTKGILASLGSQKYAIHAPNELLRQITLRDNQTSIEFIRSNPHWGGVSCGDTSGGISEVLVRRFLDTLVSKNGMCVLYTHLGKITDRKKIFSNTTQRAFSLLWRYFQEGKVLVTTTSRLLQYVQARKTVERYATISGRKLYIEIADNNKKNFFFWYNNLCAERRCDRNMRRRKDT